MVIRLRERILSNEQEPLYLGYQSVKDVSIFLQSVDVLALPFEDGVSERRTSFMAGLNHGRPIVTTLGESTGEALKASSAFAAVLLTIEACLLKQLRDLLTNVPYRRSLAKKAAEHYRAHYDWPRLANNLVSRLSHLN